MTVLSFGIGVFIGLWLDHMWGKHRARNWKKRLERIVISAHALEENNELLAKKVERLASKGIVDDEFDDQIKFR